MNYKLYQLASEFTMNYRLYTLASEHLINYRLYKIAAEHILIKTLPSSDGYEGLTVRQIEEKIRELYELLQVAFDMGIAFQVAEEERSFHDNNGVKYTNDEIQELWATGYKNAR